MPKQRAERNEKAQATMRCQRGPKAMEQMRMSWRGSASHNEFLPTEACAAMLMSEKERCAQDPFDIYD